jgi:hypothetical protein
MTGAPTDLLAECEAHGIRLTLADDGGLSIDAPQDALTPELLGRLKAHKAELLALILPGWPADVPIPAWWGELVGLFPPGFLRQAQRTDCRGCGFQVAVLWDSPERGLTWSCPQCGLASGGPNF